MATKRKSVMSLVQGYIDGQGSETKKLLDEINSPTSPSSSLPTQPISAGSSTGTSTDRQAIRSTDSQDNRLAVRLINSTADRQINSSSDTLIDRQAGSVTDSQTGGQVSKSAGRQISTLEVHQDDKQVVQQDDKLDNQHVNGHDTKHIIQQAVQHHVRQVPQQPGQQVKNNKRIWMPLTMNQGKVLMFLYESGGGLTNTDIIGAEIFIPYGTIRSAFSVLMSEGYITSKEFFSGHAFKGFTYTLDDNLCSVYVHRVRQALQQLDQHEVQQTLQQAVHQSHKQLVRQSNRHNVQQTDRQINRQTVYTGNSSSSMILEEDLKPTTEQAGILTDPELRYWAGEGVTEKQVLGWIREFQMTTEEMSLSLRYGRFDILERNDVQNPANWFYKIMTKNGFYPRPANYKSLLEIRAEALEQDLAREREAKERLASAEVEKKFQVILQNPESPEYKSLLAQTNEYARSMGGQALETVLRDEFLKNKGEG